MNSKPTLRLFTILVLVALLFPFHTQAVRAAPQAAGIPPGHSDSILRLKFVEGTPTENLAALLPAEAWQVIQKIDPLFTPAKPLLKELKAKGDERLKKEKGGAAALLPDLSLWYEVRLVQTTDPVAAIALFSALPSVETIGSAPLITEPPTGDFTTLQGYLGPATDGLNAQYAWTIPGGTGAGVTIYDVEYGWIQNHEDLSKALNVPLLLNPGDTALISSADHGTAVLGELIADNNGFGVTGIAYGANIKLAPANTANLGWNPANAILLSAADGLPGDVILVEQQTYVCGLPGNLGLGPSEYDLPVFQAIQTATALGLVVVEAAGNGGVDLDQVNCNNKFNRITRDSGAILVGAGGPPTSTYDRQRENHLPTWASSYGSRVDLQGWGSGVMTTGGEGDYYGFNEWLDEQYFYTNTFNGTSSASPMVAASVAIIQAVAIQRYGAPLPPQRVRDLLVQTGSPQLGITAEQIGPRPDLLQAINRLTLPTLPGPSQLEARILLTPADPDGSHGWYRSAPTASVEVLGASGNVEVRCALDPETAPEEYSDLPDAPCPFLGGAQVTGEGLHILWAAAMDLDGNESYLAGVIIAIDATPPVLTCPQAGPFLLGSGDQAVGPAGVDASASTLDEAVSTLSGLVSTAAVGPQSLVFTAFDMAGNQASQSCSYNVIYDFSGFYPPVAQAPALNPVTAGSTIPLKWRLLDATGSPVTNLSGVTVSAISLPCPAGTTQDQIEEYSSGSSSLQYLGDGYYQWNWKSPATYAGSCKTLKLNLGEGAGYEHIALFQFK